MSVLRDACDNAEAPMLLLRSFFQYLESTKSDQVEILAETAAECKRLPSQYAVPALVAGHQSLVSASTLNKSLYLSESKPIVSVVEPSQLSSQKHVFFRHWLLPSWLPPYVSAHTGVC
jgi:hypothetical protein